MIAFLNNLTLGVLIIVGVTTVVFVVISVLFGISSFFYSLYKDGSPLKAWTVGITLAVILLAGLKTWIWG